MVIKLQIFMIKKFQWWTQLYLFSSNQLGFCFQKKRKLLSASNFKRV